MESYSVGQKNSFKKYLKKGKKGEDIMMKMLQSHYPTPKFHIHKWDYNTVHGKIKEQEGVDYTVYKTDTNFEIHIQTKRTLVQSKQWGNYVSLEMYKNGKDGRFLKGETAHRWYHINKHNNDAIYYDYPRQQNYILNSVLKETGDKYLKEFLDYDGKSILFRMYYEDKMFDGRYTYLKYDKNSGTWTPTKFQSKYVK